MDVHHRTGKSADCQAALKCSLATLIRTRQGMPFLHKVVMFALYVQHKMLIFIIFPSLETAWSENCSKECEAAFHDFFRTVK